MTYFDLEALQRTPVVREPFTFGVAPQAFLEPALPALAADFPDIDKPGSFPIDQVSYGPAFSQLLEEIHGPDFTRVIAEKLDIDLEGRPIMVTARGMCRAKDGRIHTDTASKLVTVLIYMNFDWEQQGGRLRLLRSQNIDDVFTEIPPMAGTLLMFRVSNNSFHGHTSFAGRRRVLQINWVTDQQVVDRELGRHGLSARIKRLLPFAAGY